MAETKETAVAERPKETAIAERPPDIDRAVREVISVASGGEGLKRVERYEVRLVIPPHQQYVAGKSLQVTSDGYDYLNRCLGVQFVLPDFVPDERGELVRNPIRMPDSIYVRVVGIWYSELGALTSYVEDTELSYMLLYREALANSDSFKLDVETDEQGRAVLGDDGTPKTRYTIDPRDVLSAQRFLYRMRHFGLRQAASIARVRILKVASGIKSLPWKEGDPNSSEQWRDGKWHPKPHPVSVRLVGYKDALTPDERWEKAKKDIADLYAPRAVKEATHEEAVVTAEEEAVKEPVEASASAELEREADQPKIPW